MVVVGIYVFFHLESNKEDTSDHVNISNVYVLPESNPNNGMIQQNILQGHPANQMGVVSSNDLINKKPLSVKEVKTNIVKKSFITTSKDIATF